VYPLGIDPRWAQSDSLLQFSNTLKMKTSIMFAILQMSLGIFVKGLNSINFKKPVDFVFEFLPQFILLIIMFGWMDLLVIKKWNAFSAPGDNQHAMDIFATGPPSGVVNPEWEMKYQVARNVVNSAPPIIQMTISGYLGVGALPIIGSNASYYPNVPHSGDLWY